MANKNDIRAIVAICAMVLVASTASAGETAHAGQKEGAARGKLQAPNNVNRAPIGGWAKADGLAVSWDVPASANARHRGRGVNEIRSEDSAGNSRASQSAPATRASSPTPKSLPLATANATETLDIAHAGLKKDGAVATETLTIAYEEIKLQAFNPKELSIDKRVEWKNGTPAPAPVPASK